MRTKKLLLLQALLLSVFGVTAQNALLIPPLLTGPTFNLTMQNGHTTFYGNSIETMGFNGNILGPTLVMQAGDRIKINVKNNLGEETTVHWHGLHVSPENDGGPHSVIEPNETYSPTFTMLNNAATYWYHPHLHENTTRQVLNGLAGMIIVKDAAEASYTLPRTYGVDDFPIIVQTKSIDIVGDTIRSSFTGSPTVNGDSCLMVNATQNPILSVPQQYVRLRLLNGSAQRVYRFGLSNSGFFYQIASDDGMLSAAVSLNRVTLAPGERAEILVNFAAFGLGNTINLTCYGTELRKGMFGASFMQTNNNPQFYLPNPLNNANYVVLKFNVSAATTTPTPVTPATLTTTYTTVTPLSTASATVTRNKYFYSSGGGVRLGAFQNGSLDLPYDNDVNNDTVNLNTTEIWVLHGDSLQYHPFHIHDVHFFIVDRKDSTQPAVSPPANEAGRKDMVLIKPKETVRIIMKFEDFTSDVPYVYHCHIQPHEDRGMMQNMIIYDNIYVDKVASSVGATGSLAHPFPKFADAVTAAKDGSTIVFLRSGDHAYTYPPYITVQNKRIRIKIGNGSPPAPITID